MISVRPFPVLTRGLLRVLAAALVLVAGGAVWAQGTADSPAGPAAERSPAPQTETAPSAEVPAAPTEASAAPAEPASADAAPAPPGPPTAALAEIDRLIGTLEDPVLRDALIGQLRLLLEVHGAPTAETEPPIPLPSSLGARALSFLSERIDAAGATLDRVSVQATDWPVLIRWFTTQATTEAARERWTKLFADLSLILLIAIAARWLATRLFAEARGAIGAKAGASVLSRLPLLLARLIMDVIPLIIFVVAAYAMMGWLDIERRGQLVAVALVNAFTLTGVIMLVVRTLLTPRTPNLRLIRIDDEHAAYLYVWARRIAYTTVFGYFTVEVSRLLFLPFLAREALALAIGLTVFGQISVFVLQNRRLVKQWLRQSTLSGPLGAMLRRLSDIWHIVGIAYLAVAFGIWLLDVPGGFAFMVRATALTVLIVVLTRLIGSALVRGVHRLFVVPDDLATLYPGLSRRATRYQGVIETLMRMAVWVIAAVFLIDAWGGDILVFLAGDLGGRVVGSIVSITLVTAVSIGVWELASNLIERRLAETDADGDPLEQNQRVRTLLPLLRNVILVVLVTVVTLIVLSELGLNIAPLLAGAGVIGLAIGFGSQTLVQDVITGLFILFEDTISVGDVVNVGGHAGVVEGMSIRTLRLRDLSGNVHTIPFSQVSSVLNMTKDFSYYVFDVGVAYREDTDHVTAVLQDIGRELREDRDYGPLIVEDFEVLGVDAFADSAVVIKARIKTKPIKQWTVGREFNRRMKKRFDQEGIEIPFPHQTVYFGVDRAGAAPPARVTVAAPDMAEALDRLATGGTAPTPRPRPGRPTATAARTPDRIGEEAPRSTPGHDGDDEGDW